MAPIPSRMLEPAREHTPPSVVPLADIEKYAPAAGIAYPKTVEAWRWLHRHSEERGMAHVFVRIGRRVLVDLPAYIEALRQGQGKRERR